MFAFLFTVDNTAYVEFRLTGNVKHLKNVSVSEFKTLVSANLGIKKRYINLVGSGSGSVLLAFQMPNVAVDNLRLAIAEKRKWILEGGVLGVHIEGQGYIHIQDERNKTGEDSFKVKI